MRKLALRLPFESYMTRAAKISGAFATLVIAYSAVAILRPCLSSEFAYHVVRGRAERVEGSRTSERAFALPNVTFWAWERPEEFRFPSDQEAGIAFLAKTLYILQTQNNPSSRPSVLVRPRFQPLRVPPGTFLTAVVRIETSRNSPANAFFKDVSSEERERSYQLPSLDPQTSPTLQRAAAEIAALRNLPNVRAIQIDFDATVSQRPFYSTLLLTVRRKLPPSMPLSITALTSWCIGDPWLANLPPGTIDDAIPMLFRLGPDAADVLAFLHSGKEFPVAACRNSLGLSTDEPLSEKLLTGRFSGVPPAWRRKRLYVFSPYAQTQSAAQSILEEWHP